MGKFEVLGEKLPPLSFFPSLDLNSGLFDKKPTTNIPSYGMASLYPSDGAGFTVMGVPGAKQNVT
jgi:hypothetical protein